MTKFEEGLVRMMFVAGALDYERPFLGPLYRFLALHPRNVTRRVPSYVSLVLRYQALQLGESRHCECAETLRSTKWAPRVDAQASDIRTGIGGWEPRLNEQGIPHTSKSRWFSLEITKENWPWIYEKGDKPSLVIATLEALAVLISLKAFRGNIRGEGGTKVRVTPTWTDNRGNGAALNKKKTTRMSADFKRTRIKALVEWTPGTANREVDALANGDNKGFDPALEVKIDDRVLEWIFLPQVLAMGKKAEEDFQLAKSRGELPDKSGKQRKRRAEEWHVLVGSQRETSCRDCWSQSHYSHC